MLRRLMQAIAQHLARGEAQRVVTVPLRFGELAVIHTPHRLSPAEAQRLRLLFENAAGSGRTQCIVLDTGFGLEIIPKPRSMIEADYAVMFGDG